MFDPGKPFQPSLMFAGKASSLPYIGAPELAYSENPKIADVKSFIVQAPGVNVMKQFLTDWAYQIF